MNFKHLSVTANFRLLATTTIACSWSQERSSTTGSTTSGAPGDRRYSPAVSKVCVCVLPSCYHPLQRVNVGTLLPGWLGGFSMIDILCLRYIYFSGPTIISYFAPTSQSLRLSNLFYKTKALTTALKLLLLLQLCCTNTVNPFLMRPPAVSGRGLLHIVPSKYEF